MKRVKAACICQTLHFMLKDDVEHSYAVSMADAEVAHYKASLEKSKTKFKIIDEAKQADGSVIIKIKKQYNQNDVGDYLD